MSAILYDYVCASCGTKFQASGVPQMSYGEFILRSESGEEAYLEAITDPVFHEVLRVVRAHPLLAGVDQKGSGEVAQKIFGIACDLAGNGETFQLELSPKCPKCASRKMASWVEVIPHKQSHVTPVTHTKWQIKSVPERERLIDAAIRRIR